MAQFWSGWAPATCMPDGCFCEAVRAGTIAQPANFWSSFAFVLVAIVLWMNGGRRLYVAALFLVGTGSAFYHASLTFAGQVADMSGMYFVATFAILHVMQCRGMISGRASVISFVASNVLLVSDAGGLARRAALRLRCVDCVYAVRRERYGMEPPPAAVGRRLRVRLRILGSGQNPPCLRPAQPGSRTLGLAPGRSGSRLAAVRTLEIAHPPPIPAKPQENRYTVQSVIAAFKDAIGSLTGTNSWAK